MAEFYLISQLPSLDAIGDNTPMPIDEERFMELCREHLNRKAQREMENLTICPSADYERTGSALPGAWYEAERNLRLALAKVRAEKMHKSFDMRQMRISQEFTDAATEAINAENPLEAERFLFKFRMGYLENLRPMDNFSLDFLFYYGIKLKLIMRMRRFDTELGEDAYRDIYSSILSGDRTEAIQ